MADSMWLASNGFLIDAMNSRCMLRVNKKVFRSIHGAKSNKEAITMCAKHFKDKIDLRFKEQIDAAVKKGLENAIVDVVAAAARAAESEHHKNQHGNIGHIGPIDHGEAPVSEVVPTTGYVLDGVYVDDTHPHPDTGPCHPHEENPDGYLTHDGDVYKNVDRLRACGAM